MAYLMTQQQFNALCAHLEGTDGCNFYERTPGNAKSLAWKCDNTLIMTRQWLQQHSIENIEANIETIKSLGGGCDCEVLFNVVDHWQDVAESMSSSENIEVPTPSLDNEESYCGDDEDDEEYEEGYDEDDEDDDEA